MTALGLSHGGVVGAPMLFHVRPRSGFPAGFCLPGEEPPRTADSGVGSCGDAADEYVSSISLFFLFFL